MTERPSNPPDELAQNDSKKKSLSDKIIPFFLRKLNLDRFFNYLDDSNSIFRVGRINSENVPGCTVFLKIVHVSHITCLVCFFFVHNISFCALFWLPLALTKFDFCTVL